MKIYYAMKTNCLYRTNHSTIGCIYILKSIVNHALNEKQKLYAAFVDFKKAFDMITEMVYGLNY